MRGFLLPLALLLIALPVGAAPSIHNPDDATPTTLYFHLLDGLNDFPINTQEPNDKWAIGANVGTTTQSTSCLPAVDGATLLSQEVHTLYGYSSPSIVEYDSLKNGKPIVHPERGFSYDVLLAGDPAPRLFWYLETAAGPEAADAAPAIVPNVVVRATIRTGGDIAVSDEAYNEGEVLARSETEPSLLARDATSGPARYIPGDRDVYEFALDLPLQRDSFSAEDGFVLRVDVFMDNPACGEDGYLMPNLVRTYTAPDARPRMELVVQNPILIGVLHPQFLGDDLVIHSEINSPWGSYDVDEAGGVDFEILGPSVPQKVDRIQVDHMRGHHTHTEPLMVSLRWPYVEEGALPGTYTVRMTAWNDQHTAQATAEATFQIGKEPGDPDCVTGADGSEECRTHGTDPSTPGAGPLALVLGLVGVAAIRRRRG